MSEDNKKAWCGFNGWQSVAHTYDSAAYMAPILTSEEAWSKIKETISNAKPGEFYTFDADGNASLTIGDAPEQSADAIMIDGKIVTREDVRKMQSELDALAVARDTLDAIVSENIARRCEIEQHLMNVATGKAPLLTEQDCRILALRLGTPKAQWNAAIKNYKFGGLQ